MKGTGSASETPLTIPALRTMGVASETNTDAKLSKLKDYQQLFRVRVTAFVILTTWVGYLLAADQIGEALVSWKVAVVLTGVALVSSGAAALNQVLERDIDARMARTKDRPLPAKRMRVREASVLGTVTTVGGSALLAWEANWLTGLLTFATAIAYVYVYTPLKPRTPWSTFVGAIPGAMPPVLGWTAATGEVSREAAALFAILFLWQFPHFLAIAWLHRDDYERGGIRMLPVLDPTGKRTTREILAYGAALIPVSIVPTLLGMTGLLYMIGALVLGVAYLVFGVRLALLRLPPTAPQSKKEARELLRASVGYLPLLFGLLLVSGLWR
jgi:protoheme IX farnesyltransferase